MGEETSHKPFICIHSFSFICRKLSSEVNTRHVWSHIIPITSALAILMPEAGNLPVPVKVELVQRGRRQPREEDASCALRRSGAGHP